MKKRFIYWIVLIVLIFILAYFIFSSSIFSNINNKASLSEANEASLLQDVKTYVTNNIDKYKDEEIVIFTKKDLVVNSIIKEDNDLDEDSRVYVSINNGYVVDAYIKNRSINNYIMNDYKSDNFIIKDNNYYFVGNEVSNYISFNNELYRIIKVDSEGNLHIIKNDKEDTVTKDKIDIQIQIFKNKKYYNYINNVTLINISDYNNTIKDGKTFLESNYKYFVNTSDGYTIINGISEDEEEAALKLVIEINKDASYEKGVGTIVDPIIISE